MRCAGRDHAGALCDDHIPVRSTPEAAPSPTAPRTRWPDPASCSGGGRSLPAVHPASARRRGRECLAVTAIAPGPGVRFCQPDLIGSGGPSVPCRPPGARLTAHPPPHIVAPERGLKTRCARTSPPPRPPSRLTIGGLRTPPARRISGATVPVPTCSRAGCPSDGRLLLATTRLSPSAARGSYPAKGATSVTAHGSGGGAPAQVAVLRRRATAVGKVASLGVRVRPFSPDRRGREGARGGRRSAARPCRA